MGGTLPVPAAGSPPPCRTLSLSIAPTPPPAHDTFEGSRGREGSWQADGGQAASKELPATSRGQRQHRSLPRASKTDGFPRPRWRVTLRVSAATSPLAPCQGRWGEELLPGLTPLGSVMQNTGEREDQLAARPEHGGGMQTGMYNCLLMHTGWGAWK